MLTRLYEDALRPAGVTSSQFELLQTLHGIGPCDQTTLTRALEIDQTTLSRNLRLMLGERWLRTAADPADGRRSIYRLTPAGRVVLAEARRCWSLAQGEMERRLGDALPAVWAVLHRILEAARIPPAAAETTYRPT